MVVMLHTVQLPLLAVDTTAPVFNMSVALQSLPLRIEATGPAAASNASGIIGAYLLGLNTMVTATDTSGGAVTVVCKRQPDNATITDTTVLGPLGTRVTIVCTATDPSGNTATAPSFEVLPGK